MANQERQAAIVGVHGGALGGSHSGGTIILAKG